MNYFLFNWNPKNKLHKYTWENLENFYINYNNGIKTLKWTCRNLNAKVGDRAFLIKLGQEPKGIFASGIINSKIVWDRETKRSYVEILFDTFIFPDKKEKFLNLKFLENNFNIFWTRNQSGTKLENLKFSKLEMVWRKFSNRSFKRVKSEFSKNNPEFVNKVKKGKEFYEGEKYEHTINSYRRDSNARDLCISFHGYKCCICKKKMEELYGKLGKNFVHVHHLKLISASKKKYKINGIKDLRPVCPNCHAIIHRANPPYSIRTVKNHLVK